MMNLQEKLAIFCFIRVIREDIIVSFHHFILVFDVDVDREGRAASVDRRFRSFNTIKLRRFALALILMNDLIEGLLQSMYGLSLKMDLTAKFEALDSNLYSEAPQFCSFGCTSAFHC
jgi:hypothetical protein